MTRPAMSYFSLYDYLLVHNTWSARTFGTDRKPLSIIRHLRKECDELEAAPTDLTEWIDVMILAFDGACVAGYTPSQVLFALQHKQSVNFGRTWPTPGDPNEPTEHIKEKQS